MPTAWGGVRGLRVRQWHIISPYVLPPSFQLSVQLKRKSVVLTGCPVTAIGGIYGILCDVAWGSRFFGVAFALSGAFATAQRHDKKNAGWSYSAGVKVFDFRGNTKRNNPKSSCA